MGEPSKPYSELNLKNCIENHCFILNEDTAQKGAIDDIKVGDILLLKYNHHFIGYGRATSSVLDDKDFALANGSIGAGWTLRVEVNHWYLGNHIHYYGILDATISGSNYATVRPIEEDFAKKKIEEIASPFKKKVVSLCCKYSTDLQFLTTNINFYIYAYIKCFYIRHRVQ